MEGGSSLSLYKMPIGRNRYPLRTLDFPQIPNGDAGKGRCARRLAVGLARKAEGKLTSS